MSDLFCPATLLVARHADAEYGHPHFLSDEGGWLTDKGKAQAQELAESLRDRRIARVFTSTMQRAVESGAVAAQVLGVAAVELEGLQEFSVGALAGRDFDDPELESVYQAWRHGDLGRFIPGGEKGEDVLARFREALQEIADLHRGETVLVVTHQTATCIALPMLADNLGPSYARENELGNGQAAEIMVDADGWQVTRWAGREC